MIEINKIHCGDCLEVMKDIQDNSVDMILTDIPYGEVNRVTAGIRILNKQNADIVTFDLNKFLKECVRIVKNSIYIFCGIEQISNIRKSLVKSKLSTRVGVYKKNNPSPLNGEYLWLSDIEFCVFGRKKKAPFNYKHASSVWEFNTGSSRRHPTEKNYKLFEYLIEASSDKGHLILDPCCGSGTAPLAARQTGRNFIGIEQDKKYVDVANQRISQAQLSLF